MAEEEMDAQGVHPVPLLKILPSNQFMDGLDRRLKVLDHEKLNTDDSEPLNMKKPKLEVTDSCEKGNGIVLNVEDEVRVKDFIASSLHMNGMMSEHSSDYSQSGSLDRRYSSDSATSSDAEDCTGNQCRICKVVFDDHCQLESHINSRRMSDKRYKCCNCQKTFRDNTQLKVHARKHTGEKPFECTICNKKFTVNGNLNKHMRIHTGEKRFECPDCGKKFTQFAHLEDHLKTHSGERPFVCTYCQAAFKTKARLRKHEKSHESTVASGSNRRSVNCPKCNIVLRSNRQLASHLATHVQDTDGPFMCHFCGKTFAKYQNVLDHQRRHTEMKTFYCDFCDKKFANGSHLRRHMNSHSGVRPYSCNNCKRSFPSSQNLKRHMMTHTGEKPYNCTECDRKFLTLENLNRHRRTHTGEKPFSCEICGRVFAHSTTAKEHIRTVHTGEKPFGCPVCKQRFAISKILYKHVRNKHPEHFPQFKQAQDLTPNMKKAMDKFKRGIKCEDDDNSRIEQDDGPSNVNIKTETNIPFKEEPIDEYEPVVKIIKKESSEESDGGQVSKFETEEGEFSSVIKIEAKEEFDEKNESC